MCLSYFGITVESTESLESLSLQLKDTFTLAHNSTVNLYKLRMYPHSETEPNPCLTRYNTTRGNNNLQHIPASLGVTYQQLYFYKFANLSFICSFQHSKHSQVVSNFIAQDFRMRFDLTGGSF